MTGITLEEAYDQLKSMELDYSVIGVEEDGKAIVTQQIPESGSPVPKGGKVVLYTKEYSEEDIMVEVPDFKGMDIANANYLAGVSQVQISLSGAVSDSATVSLQDISPGEMVKQGTVITLTFLDNIDETATFVHLD